MDYINYSSLPMLESIDCSPITQAFFYPPALDKAPIEYPFPGTDAVLASDVSFARPVSSATTESIDATSSVAPTGLPPNPPLAHQPFGQLDAYSSGFPWDASTYPSTTFDLHPSPLSDDSQSPSLCDDIPHTSFLTSPPLSPQPQPHSHNHSRPPSSPTLKIEDPSVPTPKRRRGRPRLDRSSSTRSTSVRLPHNQVERKYREGLNATLECLRQAVPALCIKNNRALCGVAGQPRPTKTMILEGAIEYIRLVERERDGLRGEVQMLRGWSPGQ